MKTNRKMNRKTNRKTNRKMNRKTNRKKKQKKKQSDFKSSDGYLKHNNIKTCVYLFKKYNITNTKLLIKWMNHNHPDKAFGRGSAQPFEITEDYRIITGCWANRNKIFKSMDIKDLSKSKKKKKKKIKKIIN